MMEATWNKFAAPVGVEDGGLPLPIQMLAPLLWMLAQVWGLPLELVLVVIVELVIELMFVV